MNFGFKYPFVQSICLIVLFIFVTLVIIPKITETVIEQQSRPKNGDYIKITWLPKNNGYLNCYIGMQGTVEDFDEKDGGFNLRCDSGALLIILDNKYKFEKI